MTEPVVHSLGVLTQLRQVCGADFLILGFGIATIRWFRHMRQRESLAARDRYRRSPSQSVLIGLEILVATTIIKTIIVEPSVEGMSLLAAMTIIRTMLGWTTVLEASGRWPWQRR